MKPQSHYDSDNPALPPETDESMTPPGKGEKRDKYEIIHLPIWKALKTLWKGSSRTTEDKVFFKEHVAQQGLEKGAYQGIGLVTV